MATAKQPAARPFLPLRGVRVLAFEVAYSLPAGTRTLAELGAEVVRVAGPGRDSFYISVVDGVYLSKACVGINLKEPEGLAIAKDLAARADVICSNFVPGVMERLGLGEGELRALNPRAVVLQLSGYGSPGPWSGYPAFGPSTEAAGGMNQLVGRPDGPPVRLGSGVFSDQLGGRFAALAIIAALLERQRTGEGRSIDLSMAEAISLLVGHTVVEAGLGEPLQRRGNRDRDFAPQGVYPAAGEDEWVAITVKDNRQWGALARIIARDGGGDGLLDPALSKVEARRRRHDEIDAVISKWTAGQDKFAVEETLQRAGIAAAAVVRNRDPLFDPHLRERGLFQMVAHERPVLGFAAHPHPTTPWFADGHDRHQLRDIHFHGADNVAVLGEWLGMAEARVRELEASGVLIVLHNPEVEDRRTSFRDEDFDTKLGLPVEGAAGTAAAPPPARPRKDVPAAGRGPLRILELSGSPAGGFAGMLLAELGHDVIRVELPEWHQQHRPFSAALSETEKAFLHRRKRSVTFPREKLHALAATADAVIEDMGPGGLGSLQATTHALRRANPAIVVASISPFGLTGPKSRWEASELTVQASAGILHSTGFIDEPPYKAGGYSAHYVAGINAATAVLARCYGLAAGTCKGGHIDLSMQETYIPHWSRHIGEWAYSGTKMRRERQGFGHQGFRHTAMAADGYLYVLSLYASWEEIALFFGLEQFLGPEWSSAEYRMDHWPEIAGPYLEVVASKPRYEWFRLAAEAGYTFAPVHAPADQFENPQFAARGFLKDAEIAGRTVRTPGLPFPWPAPAATNRPPAPGEHDGEFFPGAEQ